MFREELHVRDRGRFAEKPGGSQGAQASGRQADSHSQSVPPQIRESERRRILTLMGDNPTPQKEKQVLTSEAERLHTRARTLLDQVKGQGRQEEEASRQGGAQRAQGAEQKRQAENAARAKKGLPAKDREAQKARDKARRSQRPTSSQSSSQPEKSAGQGPRSQLREVYFRLVVVRDMARSRGVKL